MTSCVKFLKHIYSFGRTWCIYYCFTKFAICSGKGKNQINKTRNYSNAEYVIQILHDAKGSIKTSI